jgi:hypothetical protein
MAALGVYGLLSFVVTSRTRELGVRTAMGAQRRDLVALIAREGVVWVACGLIGRARTGHDRQSKYEQPGLRRKTVGLGVAREFLVCAGDSRRAGGTRSRLARHPSRPDGNTARRVVLPRYWHHHA